MKNLGDKLREAREAKGLTVRDVTEATRLRMDIVENMESGSFNYPLPEIYKRGFLRIYAGFLRLDEKPLVEQYALIASRRRDARDGEDDFSKKGGKTLAKRIAAAREALKENPPRPEPLDSRFDDDDSLSDGAEKQGEKQPDYVKLGAVSAAVLLAVAVVALAVSSVSRAPAPEANPDLPPPNADVSLPDYQTAAQPVQTDGARARGEHTVRLTALADTYVRIHPAGEKDSVLYIGPLQAGESREFKTSKPLTLRVTDAEKISILRDGRKLDLKGAKGLVRFNVM